MITVKTIGAIIAGITLLGGGTGAAIYFSQPKNANPENSPIPSQPSIPKMKPNSDVIPAVVKPVAPILPAQLPVIAAAPSANIPKIADSTAVNIVLAIFEDVSIPQISEELFTGTNQETKNYYCQWGSSNDMVKDDNCEISEITFNNKNQTNLNNIKNNDTTLLKNKNKFIKNNYYKLKIHDYQFHALNCDKVNIIFKSNQQTIATLQPKYKIGDNKNEGAIKFVWGKLTNKTANLTGDVENNIECKISLTHSITLQCKLQKLIDNGKSNNGFENLNLASNNTESVTQADDLVENNEYLLWLLDSRAQKEVEWFKNKNIQIHQENGGKKIADLTVLHTVAITGSKNYIQIS